jgi:hypothetical protein
MKNSSVASNVFEWERLLEIAAERGAKETFWRDADEIPVDKNGVGSLQVGLLKSLMLRHGLWF